jgi:hypothetical protein
MFGLLIELLLLFEGGLETGSCGMQKLSELVFPIGLTPLTEDFSIDEEFMPELMGSLITKLFRNLVLELKWDWD